MQIMLYYIDDKFEVCACVVRVDCRGSFRKTIDEIIFSRSEKRRSQSKNRSLSLKLMKPQAEMLNIKFTRSYMGRSSLHGLLIIIKIKQVVHFLMKQKNILVFDIETLLLFGWVGYTTLILGKSQSARTL